ncbi:carbonyl reductase [NADPH] 3-like isoform X3 [Amphiura filiformis]|uniref:carbonyl reductase [NADPH] 3-like isoform X3 n=1 Tax=Amphiura filiformis TaxID=82378 RepID=UPI003B20EEF0
MKVAVVTGSNKGIGFACVRALCKQLNGGIVYLTSRDEGRGKTAVEELKKEGLNPSFHQLDINDQESINRLRDDLQKEHGGLDILIQNAAIAFKNKDPTPFAEQATITMATNFTAHLNVCRTLFPILKPGARVSSLSSFGAVIFWDKIREDLKKRFNAVKTEDDVIKLMAEFVELAQSHKHKDKGWIDSAYWATKMGVCALTKIQGEAMLADSRDDILVNCVDPGYVQTEMTSGGGNKTTDEGAKTPVYVALLPPGTKTHGKMFSDCKVINFW